MESIKYISPFTKKNDTILTKYSSDLKPQNDAGYINVNVLNRGMELTCLSQDRCSSSYKAWL